MVFMWVLYVQYSVRVPTIFGVGVRVPTIFGVVASMVSSSFSQNASKQLIIQAIVKLKRRFINTVYCLNALLYCCNSLTLLL
jgi:hypothetical protein